MLIMFNIYNIQCFRNIFIHNAMITLSFRITLKLFDLIQFKHEFLGYWTGKPEPKFLRIKAFDLSKGNLISIF